MATDRKIPGLNHDCPLGIDDYSYLEDVLTDELLERTKAFMGNYLSTGTVHGIVAEADPATATAGASPATPFQVDVNGTDDKKVDVHPGIAFCSAGHFLVLASKIESVSLVAAGVPASGTQYVIYVEYEEVDNPDTTVSVNYYNVSAQRQRMRVIDKDLIKVATVGDWQDATIFTTDRMRYCVPIAFVNAITSGVVTIVSVDMTRAVLASNRPWFSIVDIQHRSEIGTGSASTPHNLSLSDLSEGDLSIYRQMLKHGVVISKDRAVPGIPGKLCTEFIDNTRVLTDDALGKVTGITDTRYSGGLANTRYVLLEAYPIRVVGAVGPNSTSSTDNEVICFSIRGSNLLIIPYEEVVPAAGFYLYYTAADILQPPVEILVRDEMVFSAPDSDELVIAGGKACSLVAAADRILPLGAVGPIPQFFRVLYDGDCEFVLCPQVMVCATRLSSIGTTLQTLATEMYGTAKLKVGIVNAVDGVGLSIKVKLTGTDANGGAITETVQFSNPTYNPISTPITPSCEDAHMMDHVVSGDTYTGTAGHFIRTEQAFASFDSWQITELLIDGGATIIVIYADLDPEYTVELQAACPLAEVIWDSQAACLIRDIRPVIAYLDQRLENTPEEHYATRSLGSALTWARSLDLDIGVGGCTCKLIAAEHIANPYWICDYRSDIYRLYVDGLMSDTMPPDKMLHGTYISRAIEVPAMPAGYTDMNTRLVLFGSRASHIQYTTDIDLATFEIFIRAATIITPSEWGAWVALAAPNCGMIDMTLYFDRTTNLKIQLRMKGLISGWGIISLVADVAPI